MSCKCAKPTDEYHGWKCEIQGGPCCFLVPNSKACAEKYGEGPDTVNNKCEDCKDFYRNEDGKRCCKRKGHLGTVQIDNGIDIVETPLIDDDVVCCGGWEKSSN